MSFDQLADPPERSYLNQLPTSFALRGEAVRRLRRAAGTIVRSSPDFKQYLEALGRSGYQASAKSQAAFE